MPSVSSMTATQRHPEASLQTAILVVSPALIVPREALLGVVGGAE